MISHSSVVNTVCFILFWRFCDSAALRFCGLAIGDLAGRLRKDQKSQSFCKIVCKLSSRVSLYKTKMPCPGFACKGSPLQVSTHHSTTMLHYRYMSPARTSHFGFKALPGSPAAAGREALSMCGIDGVSGRQLGPAGVWAVKQLQAASHSLRDERSKSRSEELTSSPPQVLWPEKWHSYYQSQGYILSN